jgi:hypothetical protein
MVARNGRLEALDRVQRTFEAVASRVRKVGLGWTLVSTRFRGTMEIHTDRTPMMIAVLHSLEGVQGGPGVDHWSCQRHPLQRGQKHTRLFLI